MEIFSFVDEKIYDMKIQVDRLKVDGCQGASIPLSSYISVDMGVFCYGEYGRENYQS